MNAADWSDRYLQRKTGWDLDGCPDRLRPWLARQRPGQKVLIPGCGRGYEIAAFTEAGHEVTAIDYSAGAIEAARSVIGSMADSIICEDFFTTAKLAPGSFDVCYERTFLCALPPEWRSQYGNRISSLLKPSGILLGVFLYGGATGDGPPYPMDDRMRSSILDPWFELESDSDGSSHLPVFENGRERWQLWRNRKD